MKKIYILLSLIAIATLNKGAFAQAPTITIASLPQVGFIYEMASDTTSGDIVGFTTSAGSSSAQTWNYSTLFATPFSDPTNFLAPAGNPGASSFPSANLVSPQGGGSYGYLISNASGLTVDGAYVVLTVSGTTYTAIVNYTPNEDLIPVPYTYNDSTNQMYTATFTVNYSGFPATIKHRAYRTIKAEAFGTLTTPAGTYSNTLRLRTYETNSDSISVLGSFVQAQYDTTLNYTWLQNTQDAQLMAINYDKGVCTKIQYLQSLQFAGINAVKKVETLANLYPNPTSGITYLSYENQSSSNVSANIYDVTGRQVVTLINNQQQAAGKRILSIDVNNLQLPQGLYMVQLTVNGAMKTIKLNVQ